MKLKIEFWTLEIYFYFHFKLAFCKQTVAIHAKKKTWCLYDMHIWFVPFATNDVCYSHAGLYYAFNLNIKSFFMLFTAKYW